MLHACWLLSLRCLLNLGGQLWFTLCPTQIYFFYNSRRAVPGLFFPFKDRLGDAQAGGTQHAWCSLRLPLQPPFGVTSALLVLAEENK